MLQQVVCVFRVLVFPYNSIQYTVLHNLKYFRLKFNRSPDLAEDWLALVYECQGAHCSLESKAAKDAHGLFP